MIQVLDTTLREGEQTPGIYFDGHIKMAIAALVDKIGLEIIEAGHPVISPSIKHAVKTLTKQNLKAQIGAHARSVKKDIDLAIECGVDFLGIFYSITENRLKHVFKQDIYNAIDYICSNIAYAKEQNPKITIRYTPEDTVRSSFEHVVLAAKNAALAGADIISVADTTGFMVPGTKNNFYDYISRLKEALHSAGLKAKLAVHCHNDRGLALANALDGLRAGAEIVDCSILGLGERAGIVDMAQLLVTLYDHLAINHYNLNNLTEVYQLVSQHTGRPIPQHFPVMGAHAFTHCAGVHTHAAIQDPLHYQSLDPALINRKMNVSLDHMSGTSSLEWALEQTKIEVELETKKELLIQIKAIGEKGRTVSLNEIPWLVKWCQNPHYNRSA